MKKPYYVQVNNYMTPVRVDLTEEEAFAVERVLRAIAEGDEDALVELQNEDDEILYSNWDEWIKTHK